MFKLCFLLFIFVFVNGQPCEDSLSVDLTNATTLLDGSRLFDGVTYPKNYVFPRNISGEIRQYGCLCKLKNCVRKCCRFGSVFNVSTKKCVVNEENDLWLKKGIDLYYLNDFRKNVAVVDSNFGFLFGRPSAHMYLEDKELWFLQEDGQLYIEVPTSIPPWTVRGPDKYCIDTFIFENEDGTVRTELDALACFAEDDSDTSGYLLSSTCMLISCVFILATVAVYAWLPELRNLHGRVLMAYLLCLFVGFIFLATMQILLTIDKITADCCMILRRSTDLRGGRGLNSMNNNSCRLVGGSKFYGVMEGGASADDSTPSPTEKQDHMKPIDSEDEVSDVDQECTVFSGVSYLGAQNIADPKSESDIQRIMKELSSMPESRDGIAVSISIPVCSQGLVVLYQADTNSVMTRYAVNRISFYARGAAGSPVASCFAFTWSHGETKESAVYRCHVFRCHIAEAVSQVSSCFAKAFERIPRSMASSVVGDLSAAPSMTGSLTECAGGGAPPMQLMHVLECTVDIKESDAKGTYSHVPKERLGFKLRAGIDKQVTITVQQVTNNPKTENDDQPAPGGLYIERCFGILLAPGRSVKHSDMRLLEMVSGSSGGAGCSVCAIWNAGESALAAFNVATGDGAPAYMSLALDLVIRGIPDPLRLVIETPVKVYPHTERFWYYSKRPLVQQFYINLKESVDALAQLQYSVSSVETSGELDRSRLNLPLSLSSLLPSPLSSAPAPPSPSEPDSDGDEPLLSGTGEVSKDCGEDVLVNWAQVLRSWNGPRPRALNHLVRVGVPEALRGEVWLRLAGVDQNDKLMETYRTLISKECSFEAVISRDMARTFPAHDFFREAGGLGQDSLLRMARAYAVYDDEVGYCQGLSFLAATLLLHMPEEQAFCLLVRLMYGYGLRELYKDGFEALYMRLHQLDRLMEEQLADLRAHFQELGIEPHMFASQWFLTVFTARFPLPLVYHILDVFLLQGMDTLFQVAMALLSRSKKDLLQLDFEGVHKYFRVTLPKRCRNEETSRQIVKLACSIKVKRLHKYQLEYEKFIKEAAEKEKINVELERLKQINTQLLQDKQLLETQLNETQQALEESRKEASHYSAVSRDYREICARLDRQLHRAADNARACQTCSAKLALHDNKHESEQKDDNIEGSSETEAQLRQRVRDLELELAQVKLAHVQAQCSNQELSHQLNSALSEMQAAMNQKQDTPWLVRTLASVMEAAMDRPSFQTYLPNSNRNSEPQSPSFHKHAPFSSPHSHSPSHSNATRRVSDPSSPDVVRRKKDLNTKRHSLLVESNLNKDSKEMNRRSHDVTNAAIVKNLSMG